MKTSTHAVSDVEEACASSHRAPFLPHPSRLFVEATSRCNLSCAMCMKQHGPGLEGDLTLATFTALEATFPHLEALILNGVGESLLNLHLEQFISMARRSMPAHGWIGFQSNGLLLNNLRAVSLVRAGLDRICLSMDGVNASTFSASRGGSELDDLEWALTALDAARRSCGSGLKVGVEFVATRDNIEELPAALEWAGARGVNFALVSNLHPFDESHQQLCNFDISSREGIELIAHAHSEAERAGIQLSRYFQTLWKYHKNDQERRLVDFVAHLKREAQQRGIELDLKRLLNSDYAHIEKSRHIFARAEAVAAARGMELRLPSLLRQEQRGCSFVEQGSAFISWDGGVHPCYHLWHQCRSYANGWLHPVRPRLFGNVNERSIMDIWNDTTFRSYRHNVLRHEYPSCAACAFAPCDLVQQDQFEQDCYLNEEPCGCCLWSSGLFRCLD